MKSLMIAATLASAVLSFAAPMQAATTAPALSLEELMTGTVARGGHKCNDPVFAAAHPRCAA